MAKITVTVCDECGVQDGVKHYDIKEANRKGSVDLCGVHGASLEQLLGAAPKTTQKPRGTRSRARKVTTMEEIEKLKKSS